MQASAEKVDKPDVLVRLEKATAGAFTQLVNVPVLVKLKEGDCEEESFRQLQSLRLAYYRPLELQLLTLPYFKEVGYNISSRLIAPIIVRDMLSMGFDATYMHKVPDYEDIPIVHTREEAIGVLYALEHIAQQSKQIFLLIKKHYQRDQDSGAQSYDPYEGSEQEKWLTFCRFMEAEEQKGFDFDAVSQAINHTYESLSKHLSKI
jgi:heme oxygenase